MELDKDSRGDLPRLEDRGSALLLIITSALLVMVGLISLAAVLDRAWVLVPVIAIELIVTTVVLARALKLMDGDSDD